MTQTYNEDVRINNATANEGLHVVQNGNAKGVYIDQNSANWAVHVDQANSNKYGVYVNTAGYGIGINTTGDKAGLVFIKTSTGGGNCCYVQNAGTGKGFYVKQNGEGVSLHLNKNGTGSADVVQIDNDGAGYDIRGNGSNWYVDSTGDASFDDVGANSVSLCSQGTALPGHVNARNTAIAGGRVHAYSRSQALNVDTWCDWGLDVSTPAAYVPASTINQYFMYALEVNFSQPIDCPIINMQPWTPGGYDETASGMFEGILYGTSFGAGSVEANIAGLIPAPAYGLTAVSGFYAVFSYCAHGNPAVQGEYIVEEIDPPSLYHDLVVDFQVLGCPLTEEVPQ